MTEFQAFSHFVGRGYSALACFIDAWVEWYLRNFIPLALLSGALWLAELTHMTWLADGFTGLWLTASVYGLVVVAGSLRQNARRQRHAACLAWIADNEADALMPLDEWLEKEMARRETEEYRRELSQQHMERLMTNLALAMGHQPRRPSNDVVLAIGRPGKLALGRDWPMQQTQVRQFMASVREGKSDPRNDDEELRFEPYKR